jgi:hypothetical protein
MENIELKYETPATPTDEALTAVRTLKPSVSTPGLSVSVDLSEYAKQRGLSIIREELKASFTSTVGGTIEPSKPFSFDLPAAVEDKLKAKQATELAAAKEGLKLSDIKELGNVEPKTPPWGPEPQFTAKAATAERPRRFPYINSERTLGVSLADLYPGLADLVKEAADADGEGKNKPHFSGIKFAEDGAPLFKIKYHCRDLNCQNMGNRYVFDGSAYCRCHRCDTKLKLRPVHDGPQDDNGNFMYATELYIEGMNE